MAKGGKKGSLKAALASQQTRLKKKKEVEHAAQHEERIKAVVQAKAQTKRSAAPLRPTIPFTTTDNILLIGEGNFSFARALALHPPPELEFLPASNIIATAYDSEEECYAKYPEAKEIVGALREKGVIVLFRVDATKLEKASALKERTFDRIVWNFPHAGKGIADQDRNILSNQLLLLGFLRSAAPFLTKGPIPVVNKSRKRKRDPDDDGPEEDEAEDTADTDRRNRGTILITLRNVAPYMLWDVPKLAKNPPLPTTTGEEPNPRYKQLRSFVFHRAAWKDYEHRMTKGERAHGTGKTGEGGEDRTWEFCIAPIRKQ